MAGGTKPAEAAGEEIIHRVYGGHAGEKQLLYGRFLIIADFALDNHKKSLILKQFLYKIILNGI